MINAIRGLSMFAAACALAWLACVFVYCYQRGASDYHVVLSAGAVSLLVLAFPVFLEAGLAAWLALVVVGILLALVGTIITLKKQRFTPSIHGVLGVVGLVMYILTMVMIVLVYTGEMLWTTLAALLALAQLAEGGATVTGTLHRRFRYYIAIVTAVLFTVFSFVAVVMWSQVEKDLVFKPGVGRVYRLSGGDGYGFDRGDGYSINGGGRAVRSRVTTPSVPLLPPTPEEPPPYSSGGGSNACLTCLALNARCAAPSFIFLLCLLHL